MPLAVESPRLAERREIAARCPPELSLGGDHGRPSRFPALPGGEPALCRPAVGGRGPRPDARRICAGHPRAGRAGRLRPGEGGRQDDPHVALGLPDDRRRRRGDAQGQPRSLRPLAAAHAPAGRPVEDGHERRTLRPPLREPDLPLPARLPEGVQPRGRGRRRARRQSQERAANPVDGQLQLHRRGDQGPRGADLVPALHHQQPRCGDSAGEARRGPGLRRRGRDRGPADRAQHRDGDAMGPGRYADLHLLPRARRAP